MLSKPTTWIWPGLAGGVQGLDDAQGHRVVGGHDALQVGVAWSGSWSVTVLASSASPSARCVDSRSSRPPSATESSKPSLRWTALSASGLPSRMTTLPPSPSACGERVAGELRAGSVVGSEEGEVDACVGHGLLVERDVDVDDLDARLEGPGDGRDHGLRVGRGDDDDVELLSDEVLDGVDLGREVTLVLHADRARSRRRRRSRRRTPRRRPASAGRTRWRATS